MFARPCAGSMTPVPALRGPSMWHAKGTTFMLFPLSNQTGAVHAGTVPPAKGQPQSHSKTRPQKKREEGGPRFGCHTTNNSVLLHFHTASMRIRKTSHRVSYLCDLHVRSAAAASSHVFDSVFTLRHSPLVHRCLGLAIHRMPVATVCNCEMSSSSSTLLAFMRQSKVNTCPQCDTANVIHVFSQAGTRQWTQGPAGMVESPSAPGSRTRSNMLVFRATSLRRLRR